MYDSLIPSWFSSSGSIPQYLFVNLAGERTSVRLEKEGDFFQSNPIPICEQMSIMYTTGLPFLNEIRTQENLITAMCYLDSVSRGEDYPNMDYYLFAPSLYVGNRNFANIIIERYLCQHEIPRDKWSSGDAIIEVMQSRRPPNQLAIPADIELAERADLVKNASPGTIQKWLQANYDRNLKLAKFCM